MATKKRTQRSTYDRAMATLDARAEYEATGRHSEAELTPQLIGLEGKRVEVVDKHGKRRRFIVGKTTGWIPCHLEIARRNSAGGTPVLGAPFRSVTVIPGGR